MFIIFYFPKVALLVADSQLPLVFIIGSQTITSNVALHLLWNSHGSPTLLERLVLAYSFKRAVKMEQATSCCGNIPQ